MFLSITVTKFQGIHSLFFNIILYLILGFLCTGCGTISSRHQYVSIDSEHRGVSVEDTHGKSIGKTPLFKKQKRRSTIRLLSRFDKTNKQWNHIECKGNWLIAPLENAPLIIPLAAAGSTVMSWAVITGVLIDWLSGAIYSCPLHVQIKSNAHQEYCPQYLIYTPKRLSSQANASLKRTWFQAYQTAMGCAKEIPQGKNIGWLKRLELNFSDIKQWGKKRERVNHFGYETGASHIVVLEVKETTDSSKMKKNTPLSKTKSNASASTIKSGILHAKVIDLHTLEVKDSTFKLSDKVYDLAIHKQSKTLGFIREHLSLIPETFGFVIQQRTLDFIDPLSRDSETLQQNGISLGLTSVSHPHAFDPWDVDSKFGLGLNIDVLQSLRTHKSKKKTFDFDRLSLNTLWRGTLHSPLGAWGIVLGPALGYYYIKDERASKKHLLAFEVTIGLNYTFFITEHIMGRFNTNFTSTSFDTRNQYINNIVDAGFMLGYYFTSISKYAASLF
jgi:hypothetical protein